MALNERNLHGTDLFDVLQFYGSQNNGRRYKVRHREDGELYIMEVIPQNHGDQESSKEYSGFLHSFPASKISPYLFHTLHFFETEAKRYFILDFVHQGNSLANFVSERGVLDQDTIAQVLAQVSHCLSKLHSFEIAYGMVKPDNILIDKNGHIKVRRSIFDPGKWTASERHHMNLLYEDSSEKALDNLYRRDWQELGHLLVFLLNKGSFSLLPRTEAQWVQTLETTEANQESSGELRKEVAEVLSLLINWSDEKDYQRLKSLPFFLSITWDEIDNAELTPTQSILDWCQTRPEKDEVGSVRLTKPTLGHRLRHTVNLPISNVSYVASGCRSLQKGCTAKHFRSLTSEASSDTNERVKHQTRALSSPSLSDGRNAGLNHETLLNRLLNQLQSTKQYLEDSRLQRNQRGLHTILPTRPGFQRSYTHIGNFRSLAPEILIDKDESGKAKPERPSFSPSVTEKAQEIDNLDFKKEKDLPCSKSNTTQFTPNGERPMFTRSCSDLSRLPRCSHLNSINFPNAELETKPSDIKVRKLEDFAKHASQPDYLSEAKDDSMSLATSRYSYLDLGRDNKSLYMNTNLNSISGNSYGRLSKSAESLLEDLRKASQSNNKFNSLKQQRPLSYSKNISSYEAIQELHGIPFATHASKDSAEPYKIPGNRSDCPASNEKPQNNSADRSVSKRRRRRKSENKKASEKSDYNLRSSGRADSSIGSASQLDNSIVTSRHQEFRPKTKLADETSAGSNRGRPEVRELTSQGRSKIPIKRSKEFELLPSKQKLMQSPRSPRKEEEKEERERSGDIKQASDQVKTHDARNQREEEAMFAVKDSYSRRHAFLLNEADVFESQAELVGNSLENTIPKQEANKSNWLSSKPRTKLAELQVKPRSSVEVEPVSQDLDVDSLSDVIPAAREDEFEMLQRASREFEHDKKTLLRILRKYNVNLAKKETGRISNVRATARKETAKVHSMQRSASLSRDIQSQKWAVKVPLSSSSQTAHKGTQVTVLKRYGSSPSLSTSSELTNHNIAETRNEELERKLGFTERDLSRMDKDSYVLANTRHKQVGIRSGRSHSLQDKQRKASSDSRNQDSDYSSCVARASSLKYSKPTNTHDTPKLKKKVRIDDSATYCENDFGIKKSGKSESLRSPTESRDDKKPKHRRSGSISDKSATAHAASAYKVTTGDHVSDINRGSSRESEFIGRSHFGKQGSSAYHSQDVSDTNSSRGNSYLPPSANVKQKGLHFSKIPTIQRYASQESLTSVNQSSYFDVDDNNNIARYLNQEGDLETTSRFSKDSANTGTLFEPSAKEHQRELFEPEGETEPDDAQYTTELIQSLRTLSENPASRSSKQSPGVKRRESVQGSFKTFRSIKSSFEDGEDDLDQGNMNWLSPRSSLGAGFPSERSSSWGSESSNPDDDELGESFNIPGNLLQDIKQSSRLVKAESSLSVAENSDDDAEGHLNELGRIASFHSLRSVDSGLSDLCNNSGGDEDQKDFKGNQVDRSDSGVVKDLEKTLHCVRNESTKSSCVVDTKVHAAEDAEDGTGKLRRRQSNIENPVECLSCKRMFPSTKNKGKAEGDETCPKCHSKRVERKEAIVELIQTEINYGNDLRILKEEFYSPIKNGGILNQENLTSIFLNLQELIDVNAKLCIKLQGGLEDCNRQNDEDLTGFEVGKLFLDNADFFQAFELFCSKQKQAGELLETLQRKSELLKIFLTVSSNQNTKLRKMDLKSFLTMPVQRIMKYPLLLSRIYRATMRDQPDKEAIRKAQRNIEEQITVINEIAESRPAKIRKTKSSSALSEPDTKDKLVKVCAQILNWKVEDTQIALSGSLEVGLGELIGTVFNRKNLRKLTDIQAVLCILGAAEIFQWDDVSKQETDLQFPSKCDASEAAVILLRRKVGNKYTLYKDPVLLSQSVVCRHDGIPDAFELSPILREPFTFLGNSIECEHWHRCLHFLAKDLGSWRQRRKAMANIMIQSMS